MSGSYNAGSATLNIKPDWRGFRSAVQAYLRSYHPEVTVKVKPDMSEFRRAMATANRQRPVTVEVRADTRQLRRQFDDEKVNVDVALNLTQARADMIAFRREFAEMTVRVRVQIHQDRIRRDIREAVRTAGVDTIDTTTRRARRDAPLPGSQAELDELERAREAAAEERRRQEEERRRLPVPSPPSPPSGGGGGGGGGNGGNGGNGNGGWRDQPRGPDGRWIPNGGGGFGGASGGLRRVMMAAQPALYALLAIGAVNLVPLIAQLTQAAGAAALIVPAAGMAAAALGAIALGGMGLGDALSSGMALAANASEEAAAQAEQVEQATRNVEQAQRGLEQAHRGVEMAARGVRNAEEGVADAQRAQTRAVEQAELAQKDLTRAREDAVDRIEDLNLALRGSALDEESAILAVERSWQRMMELGRDGQPVTMLDRREADLAHRQALQRLDEVRLSNSRLREETAETNAAGVDGAENVQAAQRGVRDANEAVEQANRGVRDSYENLSDAQYNAEQAQLDLIDAQRNLADAQKDLAKAINEGTASQKKFNDAMANLSPNAQQFVRVIIGLRDAFVEMRKVVQDNLFEGMGESVQQLATEWLPILREELGAVATAINGGLRRIIGDLNSDFAQLHWRDIFQETTKSIGPLLDGLSSLAGALTAIAAAGSEFLTSGTQQFAETMQRFEDWANSDQGQNRIAKFLRESLDALQNVWEFLKSMSSLIGAIFGTAEQTGASMLEQMTSIMDEWTEWLRSPEGTVQMRDFWLTMKDTAEAILVLIGEAGVLIDRITRLMGQQGYQPHDQPVLDPQGNDGGATGYGHYGPRDIDYDRTEGNRFTGFNYYNRDGQQIDADGNRLVSRDFLGLPSTVEAGSLAEYVFHNRRTNPETGESDGLGLWSNITDLAGKGRNVWDTGWEWVAEKPARGLASFIGKNNETGAWDGGLWNRENGGWGGDAINAVADGWDTFQTKMQEAGTAVADWWTTTRDGFYTWVGDTWGSFTKSIQDGWNNWKQWLNDSATAIADWWTETRDGFYTWVSDTWDSFTTSIQNGAGSIGDWFSDLAATIKTWFSDRTTDVTDFVSNTWDSFTGAITGGLDSVGGWFEDTGQRIQDAFSALPDFFTNLVSSIGSAFDGIKSAAATPINWVIDNVINGALKGAWETVRKILPGLAEFPTVGNIASGGRSSNVVGGAFADGGTFTGVLPGYTPSMDNQIIAVGGGETVMRPEWTMAVQSMDPGYVNRMNAAAKHGGVNGVRNRLRGYADGGTIANNAQMTTDIQRSMWDAVRTAFPGVILTSATRPGDSGQHGMGRALDLVGPMQQIADWIFQTYPQSKHLIWGPGPFIADGNTDQEYARYFFRDDIAGHWDHVHWAMTQMVNSAGELISADTGSSGGGFLSGLANRALDAVSKPLDDMIAKIPDFGDSALGAVPRELARAVKDSLMGLVRNRGASSDDAVVGDTAGADQWTDKIIAALEREGFPVNDRNINLTKAQIMSESGGNANIAQQITDINGTGESAGVGLLQIIPGTFEAHRNPALPNNRRDPDANISAALRYYKSKYGMDLGAMWGKRHGYANGGTIPGWSPGVDKWWIHASGGETVMRPEWTAAVGSDYIDGMNAAARSGGVPAVQSALAGYANGGTVTDWLKRLQNQQVLNAPMPNQGIPNVDPAVAAGNSPKGLNGEDLIAPDGRPYAAMGPTPQGAMEHNPNDYIRQRLLQYGSEVWDITKAAVPEILGVQGTPLDPASNRWVQLAKQVDSTFGITDGIAYAMQNPQAFQMPDTAVVGNGDPGIRFGDIIIQVSSVDQAMREARRYQNEQVAAFSGRFGRK